jgi:hypothetical protein
MPMNRKIRKVLLVLWMATGAQMQASSIAYNYTGGNGSIWSTPSNWAAPEIPSVAECATDTCALTMSTVGLGTDNLAGTLILDTLTLTRSSALVWRPAPISRSIAVLPWETTIRRRRERFR